MNSQPSPPSGYDISFKALHNLELKKAFKKQKKFQDIDARINALCFANNELKKIAANNELKKEAAQNQNPDLKGLSFEKVKEEQTKLKAGMQRLRETWGQAKTKNDLHAVKEAIALKKEAEAKLRPINAYLLACKSQALIEREIEENLSSIDELKKKAENLTPKQIKKEFNSAYKSLETQVASLPYTFSQAHLRDLFGDISQNDQLEQILKDPFVEGQMRRLSITSKEDKEKFIALLSEILQKEQDYNSHFACYHSMEARVGQLYDLYTSFNYFVLLAYNPSSWSFRGQEATDEQKTTVHGLWHTAENNSNYDECPEFRRFGISATPSFFTNYSIASESAFASWISGGGHNSLSDNFVKNFYMQWGFPEEIATERAKEIEEVFAKAPQEPRLLQFLIHPSVVDEIAYVSLGYGVNLDRADWFEKEGVHTIKPSYILPIYRGGDDVYSLNQLQLRLLYNPEIMSQPAFVNVFNYFASNDDQKLRSSFENYQEQLNHLVAKHIGEWLENYSEPFQQQKLPRIKKMLENES